MSDYFYSLESILKDARCIEKWDVHLNKDVFWYFPVYEDIAKENNK